MNAYVDVMNDMIMFTNILFFILPYFVVVLCTVHHAVQLYAVHAYLCIRMDGERSPFSASLPLSRYLCLLW